MFDLARTINPKLDVEQEMKRVRERWKASVEELRSKNGEGNARRIRFGERRSMNI